MGNLKREGETKKGHLGLQEVETSTSEAALGCNWARSQGPARTAVCHAAIPVAKGFSARRECGLPGGGGWWGGASLDPPLAQVRRLRLGRDRMMLPRSAREV